MNELNWLMTMWYESEDDLTHHDIVWQREWDALAGRDPGETFSHYLVRNLLSPILTVLFIREEKAAHGKD